MGRIFYGIAIAARGLLTIYYRQLPYMMIPPKHHWFSDHVILVYTSGALLLLAEVCIVLETYGCLTRYSGCTSPARHYFVPGSRSF